MENYTRLETLQIASEAVEIALKRLGIVENEEISQRKAHELYGSEIVKRWVRNGLIKGERRGVGKNSKIFFSKAALEKLQVADKIIVNKFKIQ